MPPALRNHRTPTAGDTPASTAASPLERPEAIAPQNCLQFSRRASRSRPGDREVACTHRSGPLYPFIATSFAEVLRRPVESAQYSRDKKVLSSMSVLRTTQPSLRRCPFMEVEQTWLGRWQMSP